MQSPQQQAHGPSSNRRTAAGFFVLVCEALSVSAEVFVRSRFGGRYFGTQAALAVLLMFLFPAFTETPGVEELWNFLFVYMFVLLCRKAGAAKRQRTGDWLHSHYSGFPVFLRVWPFRRMDEERFKRSTEPVLVSLIGMLLLPVSESLGLYVVASAIGMAVTTSLRNAYWEQRTRDLRDAYYEQQELARRFRSGK